MHILAPCPPGWRYDSSQTIEIGKMAVKTGLWVMYEREYVNLTINGPTKAAMIKPTPLEDYFKMQGRFSGLKEEQIRTIRGEMERNLRMLKAEAEGC